MKIMLVLVIFVLTGIIENSCLAKQQQCSNDYVVGYENGLPKGVFIPGLPLLTPDGKQTTLQKVSDDIHIIAFIHPQEDCCAVNADLVCLAEYFKKYEFVSVIQVTVPSEQCNEETGCSDCLFSAGRLMMFCDKDKIAWRGFRYPLSGSVYLVNEDSRIMEIGTIKNLDPLRRKAQRMSDELRRTFDDHFIQ